MIILGLDTFIHLEILRRVIITSQSLSSLVDIKFYSHDMCKHSNNCAYRKQCDIIKQLSCTIKVNGWRFLSSVKLDETMRLHKSVQHDVIKWKYFQRYWPFVRGFYRSPVNSLFFDLRLSKRLSKQSWGWWFETPSRSLWRQGNGQMNSSQRAM